MLGHYGPLLCFMIGPKVMRMNWAEPIRPPRWPVAWIKTWSRVGDGNM
jgi:hypothetical protein